MDLALRNPYCVSRRRDSHPAAYLRWSIEAYTLYVVWKRKMGRYHSGEDCLFVCLLVCLFVCLCAGFGAPFNNKQTNKQTNKRS